MKTKHLKYILAIFSFVLFLLAISIDFYFRHNDRLITVSTQVQKVFQKKENLLKKDLGELQNAIAQRSRVLQKYKNFSEFEKDLRKDGFVLLAFKADSILFWSDNSFLLPDKEFLDQNKSPVALMEDGIYYISKRVEGEVTLYGFLLLQKKYPYQNKYLKNHFGPDIKIPDWVEISLAKEPGASIYNKKGEFMFSLKKRNPEFGVRNRQNGVGLLYFFAILTTILFVSVLLCEIKNPKLGFTSFAVWGISLFLVRYLMLLWNLPAVFSNLEIFSPELFASSFFFPSLGDFVLNVLFLFIFIYTYTGFLVRNDFFAPKKFIQVFLWIFIHLLLFYLVYFGVSKQFENLISDSSFSLQMYVFQDAGIYVFVEFLILILLFYSLGYLANLLSQLAKTHWKINKFFLLVLPIAAGLSLFLHLYEKENSDFVYSAFPVLLITMLAVINYLKKRGVKYSLSVILLLGVSVFVTNRINLYASKKEKQDRLVAAMNLSSEYDPTSETLLTKIQESINTDKKLAHLCREPLRNETAITDYIQNKYFTGFWEQYHLQVTICNEFDELNIEPDNQIRNCYEFFEEMIEVSGESIPGTNFYNLNEFDGMVSYLGVISNLSHRFEEVKVYLRLDSKVGDEGLGYPELLLDEKVNLRPISNDYSYGKYRNGKLISSSGKFNYFMNSTGFGDSAESIYWRQIDDFDHLIYEFGNNAVVVSCPTVSWYNKAITVPYIFVLFYLFGFVIWLLGKLGSKHQFRLSFKYRIQYSIVGLLMLFFVLLGGGTVYYNINQANESNNKILQEKLQLVKREVLGGFRKNGVVRTQALTNQLRVLSNLIFADIHVYDLAGELLASSRPEIFDKRLQERRMNFAAYYQLGFKERTHFIHKEKIGEMSYISAYEPLIDVNNKTIAYLNLPYFVKSQELEKEMFNLVLAGVNLHVFMILLAIFLSVIISNKIAYPLRLIQSRLKETRFGSYGEKIEYPQNDEIGSLVKEYNQMLVELEESAKRLAKSERETAWREMARQIAHEIKNPLTPMKLSIQFLQKRFEEKTPNWEVHFNRVSKTLIEQINALSSIATAFSNFAKMPLANNEDLNLVEILQHVTNLFKNDDLDLSLHLNSIEEANVFVDREQFVRVFVNLINNAIQSIPEGNTGKVSIELTEEKLNYLVKVIDNGTGVSDEVKDRLFSPNFTTKSGGMGLGLAIVKKIVENADGSISVESELNVGSCFTVQIPKYKA